jgi:hypothetical protein
MSLADFDRYPLAFGPSPIHELSFPGFWLGLALIYFLSLKLGWLEAL